MSTTTPEPPTGAVSLTLLGTFQATLANKALRGFATDKMGALLVYLVLEERPQRRETLSALFWPEMAETRARANLSQALYALRKTFDRLGTGVPLFLTDARSVQINPTYPLWVDVLALRTLLRGCSHHQPQGQTNCQAYQAGKQHAIPLYQGELLAGYTLPDCPEFEAWLRLERTTLLGKLTDSLLQLAQWCAAQAKVAQALTYAQQLAKLDYIMRKCYWSRPRTQRQQRANRRRADADYQDRGDCQDAPAQPNPQTRCDPSAARNRVGAGDCDDRNRCGGDK